MGHMDRIRFQRAFNGASSATDSAEADSTDLPVGSFAKELADRAARNRDMAERDRARERERERLRAEIAASSPPKPSPVKSPRKQTTRPVAPTTEASLPSHEPSLPINTASNPPRNGTINAPKKKSVKMTKKNNNSPERDRIIAYLAAGQTCEFLAQKFRIDIDVVSRWAREAARESALKGASVEPVATKSALTHAAKKAPSTPHVSDTLPATLSVAEVPPINNSSTTNTEEASHRNVEAPSAKPRNILDEIGDMAARDLAALGRKRALALLEAIGME